MKHVHPSTHDYLPAAGHDAFLPFYDLITKLSGVGRLHRQLIANAALAPGLNVLDIGCGTGNQSVAAKRAVPGIELTGIDPDPRALTRARKKADDIRFEAGYAQSLPYPDGTFDRVLSALMLHHIPQDARRQSLEEVARVTRTGGSLHVVDFAGNHGIRGHGAIETDDLRAMLASAGFSAVTESGRRHTFMGDVAFYDAIR